MWLLGMESVVVPGFHLMDDPSVDHGEQNVDLLDLQRVDFKRIRLKHDDVRFTSKSRHSRRRLQCPLSADGVEKVLEGSTTFQCSKHE